MSQTLNFKDVFESQLEVPKTSNLLPKPISMLPKLSETSNSETKSEILDPNPNPLIDLLINYKPNPEERLSWDDYFLCQALITSFRSPSPKLQVGAVVVSHNRIISTGYNGYFPGTPHISIHVNNHEVNTVHAEQNAIADAAKRGVSINGSTIYITHYPCLNCAKMIVASGIKDVKFLNLYRPDPIIKTLFEPVKVSLTQLHPQIANYPSQHPLSHLYSIPVKTANDHQQSHFLILNTKLYDLLMTDYLDNPHLYKKTKCQCSNLTACQFCQLGPFEYEIDKIRQLSEVNVNNLYSSIESIQNQPFGKDIHSRLEQLTFYPNDKKLATN